MRLIGATRAAPHLLAPAPGSTDPRRRSERLAAEDAQRRLYLAVPQNALVGNRRFQRRRQWRQCCSRFR